MVAVWLGGGLWAEGKKETKNAIMRSPVVRCGVDGVVFEMETRAPFAGQLYVQNEYRRPECRAEFGRHGARSGLPHTSSGS